MHVQRLAAAGQGFFGTQGALPSARRKHFSYTVPSVSKEHKSHKTRTGILLIFLSQNGEAN